MCSEFCEQLYQLKHNKTSSLDDSSPLQYSHEINSFYVTESSSLCSQKPTIFSTMNEVSPTNVLLLQDENQY